MDLEGAESYLTKRGWHFKTGRTPTEENFGMTTFVYRPSDDFGYAESFLNLYYENESIVRVRIQFSEQIKHTEYLGGVKRFAPVPINSYIKDGNLIKVYRGATTTFEFETGTAKNRYGDTKSNWSLFIVENNDYDG